MCWFSQKSCTPYDCLNLPSVFFIVFDLSYINLSGQKKHPTIKKEVIFLPRTHGGLNVLDPVIQHHILQKRWSNYLFKSALYPSFVYLLALNHLSLFLKSSRCPLVPFYFPEYRNSSVCDISLSIWHTIFDALDVLYATSTLTFPNIPLTTLLDLTLCKIIIPPDNNHWTMKHKKFLNGQFSIFDNVQQRLRLRVLGEYTRYPRLCQQLYTDILQTRLVKPQSTIRPHILEEVSL